LIKEDKYLKKTYDLNFQITKYILELKRRKRRTSNPTSYSNPTKKGKISSTINFSTNENIYSETNHTSNPYEASKSDSNIETDIKMPDSYK
ncbi:1139_t:CDS:2, partial [Gigaspora rosea]